MGYRKMSLSRLRHRYACRDQCGLLVTGMKPHFRSYWNIVFRNLPWQKNRCRNDFRSLVAAQHVHIPNHGVEALAVRLVQAELVTHSNWLRIRLRHRAWSKNASATGDLKCIHNYKK